MILISALLATVGGLLASRLPLHTDFANLLPDGQPSVVAFRELTARKTSGAVIEIGIASPDPEVTRRFARDLAATIRQRLPRELLTAVDEDDADMRRFVWDNRHLYTPLADLRAAVELIEQRVLKASGFDLGLEDAGGEPAAADRVSALRTKLASARAVVQREPGYIAEQGRLRMLILRCPFGDTDPEKASETIRRLESIVAGLQPQRYHPALAVGWCGDPVSGAIEHDLVLRDVVTSVILCLLLVVGALLAYFRGLRAVVALSGTLAAGCLVTFGFTYLWIGHLNTSTAFLGSVVAGNGINYGIILLARYFEERRLSGSSHLDALIITLQKTAVPTLVASAAAGSAYLSLTITTFRGFSEFGIIAGSGMIFCWVASYLLLPALLTLFDRRRSLVTSRTRPAVARPSWGLARWGVVAPGAIVLVVGTTALTIVGAWQLWGNPFEDDVMALRSRSYPTSASGRWSKRLDAAFGRDQSGGYYIGVQRPEHVPLVVLALRDAERGTPAAERQLGKIDASSEVLPTDQQEKIQVLLRLRRMIDGVSGSLDPGSEPARLIADLKPPPTDRLRPIGFDDLPARVRQALTERDGRKGLLLAVHPAPAVDNGSFHGLRRSVTALRSVELPEAVRGTTSISGSDVIFVEMMEAVQREGPRAALVSVVLVLLLLFLAFGGRAGMVITSFALFVGVFGMLGLMALFDVRLNFLNYIAIPITIGIGVDYPFNIVARIRQDGWGASRGVLRTAGAVGVCSLTTIIGYAVLLLSDTGAIRSFGAAAVLGELTTITAALLVVPAIFFVISRGSSHAAAGAPAADPGLTARRPPDSTWV